MDTDLEDLVHQFYNYFLTLYNQTADHGPTPGNAFIAFEPIGTAITPETFQTKDGAFLPNLELEQFSSLANTVPMLNGSTIVAPSLYTFDDAYEILLLGSQPLTAGDAELLGHFKDQARQEFDGVKTPPLIGASEYHPVYPTPKGWSQPATAASWKSYSYSKTETESSGQSTGTPPPLPPNPKLPIGAWNWKVVSQEMRPMLKKPALVSANLAATKMYAVKADSVAVRPQLSAARAPAVALQTGTAAASKSSLMAAGMSRRVVFQDTNADAPVAVAQSEFKTAQLVRLDQQAVATREIVNGASTQEVTSKSVSLSFDYCLVTAERKWVSGGFIANNRWYVPGCAAGEFASGTGTGNGKCEVIPMAALLVKNLRISADWSHDDMMNAASAAAFGPFSLFESTAEAQTNTIVCPGMQIVAWVCEPLPLLPPAADPAKAAAA